MSSSLCCVAAMSLIECRKPQQLNNIEIILELFDELDHEMELWVLQEHLRYPFDESVHDRKLNIHDFTAEQFVECDGGAIHNFVWRLMHRYHHHYHT